jgi:hypothetical protein
VNTALFEMLGGALTALIGGATAFRVSLVLSDREHLRHQKGVAKALKDDLIRIRDELRPAVAAYDRDQVVYIPNAAIPHVHPWLYPMLPDLAHTARGSFGSLMALERELRNMELIGKSIDSLRARIEPSRRVLKDPDSFPIDPVETRWELEQLERREENLIFQFGEVLNSVKRAMETLHKVLDDVIARRPPSLISMPRPQLSDLGGPSVDE